MSLRSTPHVLAMLLLATMVGSTITPLAHAQQKRALDHDDVNAWNRITTRTLSDDGQWMAWVAGPAEGDQTVHLSSVDGRRTLQIPRGTTPRFSGDLNWLVVRVEAPFDSTRQARLDKKKDDEMPPDSIVAVNLRTLAVAALGSASEFKVPADASSLVAWKVAAAHAVEDSSKADSTLAKELRDKLPKKPEGGTLVIRDLETNTETRVDHVTGYEFAPDGTRLVLATQTNDGAGDGLHVWEAGATAPETLLDGAGRYTSITFGERSDRFAFLSDRDSWPAELPVQALYVVVDGALRTVPGHALPEGWGISEHGNVRFSHSGERLFFGTAPRPEPAPDQSHLLDSEKVEVDVWAWTDPLLQPMQLVQAKSERERTWDAVYHLDADQVVQLAREDMPDVTVSDRGDGRWALGESNLPYRQEISWESPDFRDAWIVDVETGDRRTVVSGLQGNTSLSPTGAWVYWWDGNSKHWMAFNSADGSVTNLTESIPHDVSDFQHDWPMLPSSEGAAGWTEGDRAFLIYDPYDIWAVDPAQPAAPRNLTEGTGRDRSIRFRVVDLDSENPFVEPELVLSAFNYDTKENGWFTDRLAGEAPPRELVFGPYGYNRLDRADDNPAVVTYSRESFEEYPEVWTARLDLSRATLTGTRQLSTTNPQQADFTWGSARLVEWTSLDGQSLDGILYTPEGFDASKTYPMMVYFYEKSSSGLFNYFTPSASRASIDRAFYVSRGYLLFVPDIPYKLGYPGESAMNAVMPGVTSLIEAGFVDRDRIGVQGHSWGGYQIAYMVTQTNLFAAAEAGAPVVNMTSAYGGIRWASGMSRMFQYERTQSRIGGTLWNAHHRYIANSPLFEADKVETPLLMMHNDADGAVPWYQGIEYFVALRRLGKPVWMLNYNDQGHGLSNLHDQRDWSIRMQQFFDHYLMDAPAPVWLERGIPAVEKGRTLGLEPADAVSSDRYR
ncbi:MAG: prolyl oligopeptidase family serine peptidase [Rhodothermales bacterium]